MARLPAALARKEAETNDTIRTRRENLDRLNRQAQPPAQPQPQGTVATTAQPVNALPPQAAPTHAPAQPSAPAPTAAVPQVIEPQILGNAEPTPTASVTADPEELRRQTARADTAEGMLRKAADEKRGLEADFQTRLEQQQRENEELKRQLAQKNPPAPLTRADCLKAGMTEEQINSVGEDFAIFHLTEIRKLSLGYSGEITALQKKVSDLEKQRETERKAQEQQAARTLESQKTAFWARLATAVPGWKEQNANPEFKSWLLTVDPVSGRKPQSGLKEAQDALDVERVIAIFQAWPQSQPEVRDPSRRILPNGRPPADLPIDAPGKPVVTRADIREHAARLSRDKRYRGSDEANRVQARIDDAAREGRIQ